MAICAGNESNVKSFFFTIQKKQCVTGKLS